MWNIFHLRTADAEGPGLNAHRIVRLAACCALLLPGTSWPVHARAGVPDRIPDTYAGPAQLVTIGRGRQLDLRCGGKGSPTILLEAGSHADSSTWFRVQPLLAAFTRVCSYDRAGYGFSDAGPLPRDLDADVADLHALIEHAAIARPLVLVGHSLGSNIVRMYATRHPADVSAMVLLDPPAQDIAAFAPQWARDENMLDSQRFAFIRRCEAAAAHDGLAHPPPGLESCVARADPMASDMVNAATHAWKSRPAFWQTLLSELQSNVAVFGHPVAATETHGATPLVVLSADGTYADLPGPARKKLGAARAATQARIAETSSRGRVIKVTNTSHDIQMDRPEAVVDAIRGVLRQMSRSD